MSTIATRTVTYSGDRRVDVSAIASSTGMPYLQIGLSTRDDRTGEWATGAEVIELPLFLSRDLRDALERVTARALEAQAFARFGRSDAA
jgi:hypothetical protein